MSDVITLQPLPPPDADFSIRLPTQDDLPCDDGMPMETPRHGFQMWLLIDALCRAGSRRGAMASRAATCFCTTAWSKSGIGISSGRISLWL